MEEQSIARQSTDARDAEAAGPVPDARDPYPDALRAAALLVVVLGHWLATLPRIESGALQDTEHMLVVWAPAALLTWIAQVVPLFVFISAAVSVDGVRRRLATGQSHSRWWADRALGLARPTVTYLAVLVAFVLIEYLAGGSLLRTLNYSVTVHLWFLLVLLGVQVVLPLCVRADERWGLRAVAGLIVVAALIDLGRARIAAPADLLELGARAAVSQDAFGWLNVIVIWLVPQQLGIAWQRGRLAGRHVGPGLLLFGAAWLGLAVAAGYPVAMVDGEVGGASNLLPPTLALLGVMWFQVGAVLLLDAPLRRFLERRRLERGMAMFAALGLQLYLWHKLAELPAAWLGARLHLPIDAGLPGEPGFWLGRLGWLGLCILMVMPLLVAVVAFEKRRAEREVAAATGRTAIVSGGVVLMAGLGACLALGANPGAIVGLAGVALASYLLRAHPRH